MSADRLAEIKARAEQVHWTSTSTKQAMARMAPSAADVPWLVEQVERLERWKAEALPVMDGLQELGEALGLPLGMQVTGPAALAEVERLTAERDALAAQVERLAEPTGVTCQTCGWDTGTTLHKGHCQPNDQEDQA